jgi:putative inorganic carbon (hco3(-)) transporter
LETASHIIQIKRLTQFLYISILFSPVLPPVVLLAIGLATPFLYKGKWKASGLPEGVFLGFVVLSFISWLFNPYLVMELIPAGFFPILFFGLYYLLTIWVKHVLQWTWEDFQKMYMQFWFLGLYVAVVTILQRVDIIPKDKNLLFYFLGWYPMQQAESVRSIGTASNSNLAAAMLICLALLSIYASSIVKTQWQKVGCFAAFFLFGAAIWCTGSRGAWVGLLIGMLMQVWMTGNRRRTVALFLGLLILGLIIYTNKTLIPREETLFATAEVRIFVWQNSFEIFKEHWLLGVLPLHFGHIFEEMTGRYLFHAHNVFLGIASEYGIVGLFLFLMLVVTTTSRARRWRKTANKKEEKRLAGMLISLMYALLGHGMYDYPIISPQIGIIFMLAVIVIHTQYEQRCLKKKPYWMESDSSTPYPEHPLMQQLSALWMQFRIIWRSLSGRGS